MISEALNVPQHKVSVRVRRIGGGFGGKAHCASLFAVPAAIAAVKLSKPVKCSVERYDDMAMSGTRHPFKCDYKIAIRKDGTFENVEWKLTSNCGHTRDMSIGVMNRAMVHADSVYRWPNADIYGRICKTNLASNTAFRGFGAPQAMFATETMLKQLAEQHGFDVNEIREKNMYNEEGDCTPFGTHLHQCNIRRCWSECMQLSDYHQRLRAIDEFNRKNKYRKRGIYIVPTKFGIGFSVRHCNQAGALVNIYTDGSVLISHGGMEMGQGLYTKMMQVTARCLGIDVSLVHIDDTATSMIPNASSTAASSGSDLNGRAIIDACAKLNARLEPIKKANPAGTWKEWIRKAYLERISLSASGFAIIHQDPVNFVTGKGAELFEYFVYGAACSEVEVDCLSGDHRFLRADIVMDVGDSLNPAIDIGQIEGAFLQGYGLFTMEEVKIGPDGTRRTRGPATYKIPSADDCPRVFNVKFLKGSANKVGVFSSKGLGEPPLFLGSSALFAIREAIRAFRIEHGKSDYFRMDSPATAEKIRLLCEDSILEKVRSHSIL
ncbi:unnamed protein product [Toxocara canis]|uniref:Ald_Xan_dh_C2 domain-containing protein n=1 Tax=Toxocara canis TaxID=6265 RepID=A0A183VCX6_TOXCA|nr:unnamed protein product [Toxocara canis]